MTPQMAVLGTWGHADNSEAALKHETQLSHRYTADPAKNITVMLKRINYNQFPSQSLPGIFTLLVENKLVPVYFVLDRFSLYRCL